MVIHQASKFRLYPNGEQRIFLARRFGCAGYVYNHFLRERIDSLVGPDDPGRPPAPPKNGASQIDTV